MYLDPKQISMLKNCFGFKSKNGPNEKRIHALGCYIIIGRNVNKLKHKFKVLEKNSSELIRILKLTDLDPMFAAQGRWSILLQNMPFSCLHC